VTEDDKILLKKVRALYQYMFPTSKVICNETNNTSESIKNDAVNVALLPFKPVIHITFAVKSAKNF
jgi:hypothetical protein